MTIFIYDHKRTFYLPFARRYFVHHSGSGGQWTRNNCALRKVNFESAIPKRLGCLEGRKSDSTHNSTQCPRSRDCLEVLHQFRIPNFSLCLGHSCSSIDEWGVVPSYDRTLRHTRRRLQRCNGHDFFHPRSQVGSSLFHGCDTRQPV